MSKPVFKGLLLALSLIFSASLWAGEALFVDVRSVDEFNAGHVEGAVNIPHTEVAARIGEVAPDKDARLYLYCRSGRRADGAKSALEQLGYSDVVNLRSLENAQATWSKLTPAD